MDSAYPLLVHRFVGVVPPRGFFLSRDSDVLQIARGGQVDMRPLFDQLPPCRDWQRQSPRCLNRLSKIYKQLGFNHSNLPSNLASLLQKYESDALSLAIEKSKMEAGWSAFVPRNENYANAFHTVAFTQISLTQSNSLLERHSCVKAENCGADGAKSKWCDKRVVYQSLVVKDIGKVDGIERLFFGFSPLHHWSTSLLLADVIHHFLKVIAPPRYGKTFLNYSNSVVGISSISE